MKYLYIGDAYIGRDGIVSPYPRGNGLDACCIHARDLLDPSIAKQREVKAYIKSSIEAAGKLGLKESTRVLERNIQQNTDATLLSETMQTCKKVGRPVSYANIKDYTAQVRRNEIAYHLGVVDTAQDITAFDQGKLAAYVNAHRASNVDDLFDLARTRVKDYARIVHNDPTAVQMLRTNEAMQRSHEREFRDMPEWAQKMANDNGVAIMSGGNSDTNMYAPFGLARVQACLLAGHSLLATYLRSTALTYFSKKAFDKNGMGESATAEETWHLLQDRCFPNVESDPHINQLAGALNESCLGLFRKISTQPAAVTPGEKMLLEMVYDASHQHETGIQERFANMMQALTNPSFADRRNELCQHAPDVAKTMLVIVNRMEAEAKALPSRTHQNDYGLNAIPVYGEGKGRGHSVG